MYVLLKNLQKTYLTFLYLSLTWYKKQSLTEQRCKFKKNITFVNFREVYLKNTGVNLKQVN